MRCLVIGEVMLCVCDWRNWESLSNTYSCLHEKISQQGREGRRGVKSRGSGSCCYFVGLTYVAGISYGGA
jgi:hypothetical protein